MLITVSKGKLNKFVIDSPTFKQHNFRGYNCSTAHPVTKSPGLNKHLIV